MDVSFFIAFIIIASSCSAITVKNLVGYSDFKPIVKSMVSFLVGLGWFGVAPLYFIKKYDWLSDGVYSFLDQLLHYMLAFMFILFVFLMVRDIVWFILFKTLKLVGKASWEIDPNNSESLNKANLAIIAISLFVCFYASWQANKTPSVTELSFYSNKLTGNLRIVQISDMHLSRMTSNDQVKNIVSKANSLTPDVIVLTGDIIGDKIEKISPLLETLRELGAPYGVYAVMGDHEFYNNVYEAKKVFENMGITFLFNGGITVKPANVFIAGIPDYSTMAERVNLWRTIYKSDKENYRVLLSHNPLIINGLSKEVFDVVLSGHTHGGQFFPFSLIIQKIYQYLAGTYNVNGIDLFVSRGTGTLGPKMRLFAPADIAIINLRSK